MKVLSFLIFLPLSLGHVALANPDGKKGTAESKSKASKPFDAISFWKGLIQDRSKRLIRYLGTNREITFLNSAGLSEVGLVDSISIEDQRVRVRTGNGKSRLIDLTDITQVFQTTQDGIMNQAAAFLIEEIQEYKKGISELEAKKSSSANRETPRSRIQLPSIPQKKITVKQEGLLPTQPLRPQIQVSVRPKKLITLKVQPSKSSKAQGSMVHTQLEPLAFRPPMPKLEVRKIVKPLLNERFSVPSRPSGLKSSQVYPRGSGVKVVKLDKVKLTPVYLPEEKVNEEVLGGCPSTTHPLATSQMIALDPTIESILGFRETPKFKSPPSTPGFAKNEGISRLKDFKGEVGLTGFLR